MAAGTALLLAITGLVTSVTGEGMEGGEGRGERGEIRSIDPTSDM